MPLPKKLTDLFNGKTLRALFNRLVALLPGRRPRLDPVDPGRAVLPYRYVVDLFRFREDKRYVTEKQKQYLLRQAMKLPLGHGVNWGNIQTLYADPKQKITIPRMWPKNTIMPAPPPDQFPSSAAIFGSEDSSEFGKWLIVTVRREISDPENPLENMVFGLYGQANRNGDLVIKKILAPSLDDKNSITGLQPVDLSDRDAVSKALVYGTLCADQVIAGREPSAQRNLAEVMEMAADERRMPWIEDGKVAGPGMVPG